MPLFSILRLTEGPVISPMSHSGYAFRLPTSTDNFYPDFIVLLEDGRILIIEYKGERDRGSPDVEEKKNLGELWAKKSDNLFLMAWENEKGLSVYQQIGAIVGKK